MVLLEWDSGRRCDQELSQRLRYISGYPALPNRTRYSSILKRSKGGTSIGCSVSRTGNTPATRATPDCSTGSCTSHRRWRRGSYWDIHRINISVTIGSSEVNTSSLCISVGFCRVVGRHGMPHFLRKNKVSPADWCTPLIGKTLPPSTTVGNRLFWSGTGDAKAGRSRKRLSRSRTSETSWPENECVWSAASLWLLRELATVCPTLCPGWRPRRKRPR